MALLWVWPGIVLYCTVLYTVLQVPVRGEHRGPHVQHREQARRPAGGGAAQHTSRHQVSTAYGDS